MVPSQSVRVSTARATTATAILHAALQVPLVCDCAACNELLICSHAVPWRPPLVQANMSVCEEISDEQISFSTDNWLQTCVAADRSGLCVHEEVAAACPIHCGRCGDKPPSWGMLLFLTCIAGIDRNHCLCCSNLQGPEHARMAKFAERTFGAEVLRSNPPFYRCSYGRADGQCGNGENGKRLCPVTCDLCGARL